ncbi:hypothetical protein, partial [Thiolapillus sp.]|uniref:hypothetical protein n=1 Tax=Thiolapillus sp. TaxID=2017437 RepID=UPI00263BE30E
MSQPSWSPSTTQQLRKLVAAPYLSPNDWTPRLDAYFASPLALCARRVSSAASRLLGSTSLRFALHGWQRMRLSPENINIEGADGSARTRRQHCRVKRLSTADLPGTRA